MSCQNAISKNVWKVDTQEQVRQIWKAYSFIPLGQEVAHARDKRTYCYAKERLLKHAATALTGWNSGTMDINQFYYHVSQLIFEYMVCLSYDHACSLKYVVVHIAIICEVMNKQYIDYNEIAAMALYSCYSHKVGVRF